MDELLLFFIMLIIHDGIVLNPLERRIKALEEVRDKEGANG